MPDWEKLYKTMMRGLVSDFDIQLMESVVTLKEQREKRLLIPPKIYTDGDITIRPHSTLIVDCGPSEAAAVVRINIEDK